MQINPNEISTEGVFKSKIARFRYFPTSVQVFIYTPATRSHILRKSLRYKEKREFQGKLLTQQKNQKTADLRDFLLILEVFAGLFREFSSKKHVFSRTFRISKRNTRKIKRQKKVRGKRVREALKKFSNGFQLP